jgi:hypothetical protein
MDERAEEALTYPAAAAAAASTLRLLPFPISCALLSWTSYQRRDEQTFAAAGAAVKSFERTMRVMKNYYAQRRCHYSNATTF